VNITEGGFMKHFAMLSGAPAPYTWFQYYVDEDPVSKYGIVGIMIYPLENGTWPGPFPDTTDYGAPGDLAIVTFKAILQDPDLDLTDEKAMWLDEIILANTEVMEIPYNAEKTAVEGKCKYTITRAVLPIPMGAYLDLFAGNYFARAGYYGFSEGYNSQFESFGGTGWNYRSDAFAPQAGIELTALVLWNKDPVMNKPVSYQILDAKESIRASNVSFTDEEGFATVIYRIPGWPPYGDPIEEGIFGDWQVRTTVDVGGNGANDTLIFRVGWLVEVKVTPDKTEYNKYAAEHLGFELTFTTISMQTRVAYGEIVVFDNLSVPIGVLSLENFEFGLGKYINAPLREKYEVTATLYKVNVTTCIQIPKTAFVGMATVVANMFTKLPWEFGVAYCPAGVATFEILGKK